MSDKLPTFPLAAREVLPHRGNMLLLDEVSACRGEQASCIASLEPGHVFVDEAGVIEPVALVEILSQGAAALRGLSGAGAGESPKIGYLAGIKAFTFIGQARSGQELIVDVRETVVLGSVALMEGKIFAGDECLAQGTLKVWEESEVLPSAQESIDEVKHHLPAAKNQPVWADGCTLMHRALLDSLLKTSIDQSENRATGDFHFDASFPGFTGHFPQYPILPGIFMLKTALAVCEELLQHRVALLGVEQAKFSGQVRPQQSLRTEVNVTRLDDGWRIKADLSRGDDRVARFSLIVGPVSGR